MKIEQKYIDGYVEMTIPSTEVKWAKVQPHQGDSFQGAPEKWCIDVKLTDKYASAMIKAGFHVKGTKGDYWITPKSAKFEKDGKTQKRNLLIVGADGRTPVTEELGNGTIVNIKIGARKWPNVAKISTYINGIQVLSLVEFGGSSSFEDTTGGDDEGQF